MKNPLAKPAQPATVRAAGPAKNPAALKVRTNVRAGCSSCGVPHLDTVDCPQ